jgi:hypothetical protein
MATVRRARVTVVARQRLPIQASRYRVATLHAVADVPVIANQRRPGNTAHSRVTTLNPGAKVSVIAHQSRTANALPGITLVLSSADITVSTSCRIGHVETPCGRIAGIIGARIPIIAVHRGAGDAFATGALVAHRARVAIIAGSTVIGRLQGASPREGVAGCHQTRSIAPLRGRAFHH